MRSLLALGAALLATTAVACERPPAAPVALQRSAAAVRSDQALGPYIEFLKRIDPEKASQIGFEECDEQITDYTLGFRERLVAQLALVKGELERRRAAETDPGVVTDLAIALRDVDLQVRRTEATERLMLPEWDVAGKIYAGLTTLLDDQIAPPRRPLALRRLRRYLGLASGSIPLTELAMADYISHLTRPGLVPPTRAAVKKWLATSHTLRDGIGRLFKKYAIPFSEEPLETLRVQLDAYDKFLEQKILPIAREDFALPQEIYALRLESFGVRATPDELIATGHREFDSIRAEIDRVATEVAKQHGFVSSDYRAVLSELKKSQIPGDAALGLYQRRLAEIEALVRREDIVTLPTHPARIRIGTPAESAQQPAPHMNPPRLIGNMGETGEFVLPLAIAGGTGTAAESEQYDDFTYDAIAWTLTAHELRPGHELQFDAMVDNGVSLARGVVGFNSANVEGWALYAEWLMLQFMPPEAQLGSLQFRLQRAARMFLDPELQRGKWTFDSARDFLVREVGLSHAFATAEVERYTFKNPGQATAYMYGLLRMRALRSEVEKGLGERFNQHRFHDAVVSEGLLPPDLLREAVLSKLGLAH